MRRILTGTAAALMLLLAGCNMSLPQATPTIPPTRTTTPTPLFTRTLIPTQTITVTTSPTITLPPTETFTPSATVSPTDTLPATLTPLPIIPTDVPTLTPTPRPTDTPSITPTGTPSETWTPSITPTLTASATFTLPPTATIDSAATQIAQISSGNTQVAATLTAELQIFAATLTQMAAQAPTRAPTIPATPTFVTAAPGTIPPESLPDVITFTPIFNGNDGFSESESENPTVTPLPPSPTFAPTPFFEAVNPDPLIQFNPVERSYALSTGGGGLQGNVIALPGGAVTFAQNPVNPNLIARVAQNGSLFVTSNGAADFGARLNTSPFSEFEAASPETNNARVTLVRWSPDGRFVAYLIDTWSDGSDQNNGANDGVYYFEPGVMPSIPVFRNCPPELSCQLVSHGAGPYEFRAYDIEWTPTSTGMLLRLYLENNVPAFTVIPALASANANQLPPIYRYEFAAWSLDGTRILASGAGEDGIVGVRWVDPYTGTVTRVVDASAAGWYFTNAAETPNGIMGLGTQTAGSPLQLVSASNGILTPISASIGTVPPERAAWSPDHTAVLVVTKETINAVDVRRYYVARINGTVEEITGYAAGALAIEWVITPP